MSLTDPAYLDALWEAATPEEREEIKRLLDNDLSEHLWRAQVGRQSEAADSLAFITGYGGAAGGGKSDLIAGLSLTEHQRTAIFRREKVQTEGIIQRMTEILGATDGYNSQKSAWRITTSNVPRLIEFAGLDNPTDHQKWQGRPHDLKCVGAGTLIWMADGSRKAVELVQVGDLVWTLEGPRRVTRTMKAERPAIRVFTEYGEQVQAEDHALLGPAGWSPCPPDASSATQSHASGISAGSCVATFATPSAGHGYLALGQGLPRGCGQDAEPPRSLLASFGGVVRIVRESVGEVWSGLRQGDGPLASPLHVLRGPRGQHRDRAVSDWQGKSPSRGVSGAGVGSSLRDWLGRYSSGPRPCDGQPRLSGESAPTSSPQQGGAGQQTPIYLLEDDGPRTPTHTRRKWSFPHPYGKGKRQTDHPVRVASWRAENLGVLALFDLTVDGANHYVAGSGFVNRNCYDEVTEQRESQVRFTMGWTRSNDPAQRCRVLMTFNPPTTADGRWVISYFGPWLDPNHPNPAKPGELRWFTTIKGEDVECPDGRSFVLFRGEPLYDFDPSEFSAEKIIAPRSRTFVPSRVTDNYFYVRSGYIQTLQSLPEPLRSQMLDGDFSAGVEDDPWQVIPSTWVDAAMARWQPRDTPGVMESMGVDPAAGGRDNMTIYRRHGTWFDYPIRIPGVEIPQERAGPIAAGHVISNRSDKAVVHADVIGWGLSCCNFLTANGVQVVPINFANGSKGKTKDGTLEFTNLRAEIIWRMREELDPTNPYPIALPPDPRLRRDLCSYRWDLRPTGILIESKEVQKKRLGHSPDDGDACCLANITTLKIETAERLLEERRSGDRYGELD